MPHKAERVLLVDDDATVGSFAHDVLTLMGYEVVVTTRSQEALATFQAAPQNFAALITDIPCLGCPGLHSPQRAVRYVSISRLFCARGNT